MLSYSDVRTGVFIVYNGEPYEVSDSHIFRKQQRKPVNQVKLKNLITGKQTDATFHQSDKIEPAEIDKRDIKYVYTSRGESVFADPENPSDRFPLPEETVASELRFIKENDVVTALVYDEQIVGIDLPIKVNLAVAEAPPNVKGNTSSGGSKPVTLETGHVVTAPLFINQGDILRINTETGEYVERVEKA